MDDCLQHNCGIITTQELSEHYDYISYMAKLLSGFDKAMYGIGRLEPDKAYMVLCGRWIWRRPQDNMESK